MGVMFQDPQAIAVDEAGKSYVADRVLRNVQIADSNGVIVGVFNGTQGGGTEFQEPRAISVDRAGNVYVTDSALDTVQAFDGSGSFLFAFDGAVGEGTQFQRPVGIAVNGAGSIYVTDDILDTVQVFGYPISLTLMGECKKNVFFTETERFAVIRWVVTGASDGLTYRLHRNGALIATFSSSDPQLFEDHNLQKNSVYYYLLTVENQSGVVSQESIRLRCQ